MLAMQPNAPQTPHHDSIQTFIPTQNKQALFAYYFGVFGFVPFLGLPLTIAAIIMGYLGLRKYRENPTPGAKGHAIAGIVMGWIQVAIFAIFITFMVVSLNTKA